MRDLPCLSISCFPANPHNHSNFAAFSRIKPFADVEPVGKSDHLEWLQLHLPLYASFYIEDADPEWADLDYSIEVGAPPEQFWEFARQYDWRVYALEPDLVADR